MRLYQFIIYISISAVMLVGCANTIGDETASAIRDSTRAIASGPAKNYEELIGDTIGLSTIRSVAVFPFDCIAAERGFDSDLFSTKLANRISAKGEMRVTFPNQAMEFVNEHNNRVKLYKIEKRNNALFGTPVQTFQQRKMEDAALAGAQYFHTDEKGEPQLLDPIKNTDHAIKIGRLLKVDAVIVGMVTDFDPYNRPKVGVVVRLFATGNSETRAQAVAEMAKFGVPRSNDDHRGEMWYLQQLFDSRDGAIGRNAKLYAMMKYTEDTPQDLNLYTKSYTHYYEFICSAISSTLSTTRNNSIEDARLRALRASGNKAETERQLARIYLPMPDSDLVVDNNLPDRLDRSWRPDVYNESKYEKNAALKKSNQIYSRY